MSVPPPPAPGGPAPLGQPGPYGPPPGHPGGYGSPPQVPPGTYGDPRQDPPGSYGPPPGQPGSYGPPPQGPPLNYAPAPPMPPEKPKRNLLWLRILAPVVVAIIVGIIGVVNFTSSPDNAKVGDCLIVKEFKTSGAEPKKAACDDPAANVKVAVKINGKLDLCPNGDYDKFSMSGRDAYILCLVINAKQGDCFSNFTVQTAGYQKVSCTDPAKDAELVKAVDGTVNADLCQGTGATLPVVYAQPATTLCIKVQDS